MPVKMRVLESLSGVGKTSGKAYTFVLAQVSGGRTGKMFSEVDLKAFEGKEVTAEVALRPDKELFLKPTIVSVK